MAYDFKQLSHLDFEDLSRDLIGKSLNIRFEAFGSGRDNGIDGRYVGNNGTIILQCKHMVESSYTAFRSAIREEAAKMLNINPERYILSTSQKITPARKNEIYKILQPYVKSMSDIVGPNDLNTMLREFPHVEKAHFKLWLPGSSILERFIDAGRYGFKEMSKKEIMKTTNLYVPNASFSDSLNILESHGVLIITGRAGVGKTALGQMLTLWHALHNWEISPIKSLHDGFAAIKGDQQQLILFDDFLGDHRISEVNLAREDAILFRFIQSACSAPNVRLIMTTRTHLLETARIKSENLSKDGLRIFEYILNVGSYTRRIRARILYNHLLNSRIPRQHVQCLVSSKNVGKIIDHDNFTPRLVETMTDEVSIRKIESIDYPQLFLDNVRKPYALWDKIFYENYNERCKDYLIALYLMSEYVLDARLSHELCEDFYWSNCEARRRPHESLGNIKPFSILQANFIQRNGNILSFINPSVKDFASRIFEKEYSIMRLLCIAMDNAPRVCWIERVWSQIKKNPKSISLQKDLIRDSVLVAAKKMKHLPIWYDHPNDDTKILPSDHGNIERIVLLIEMSMMLEEPKLLMIAHDLIEKPVQDHNIWRNITSSLRLLNKFTDKNYMRLMPRRKYFINALRRYIIDIMSVDIPHSQIYSVFQCLFTNHDILTWRMRNSLGKRVWKEVEQAARQIEKINMKNDLERYHATLKYIKSETNISENMISQAESMIMQKMSIINSESLKSKVENVDLAKVNDGDIQDEELYAFFDKLLLENRFMKIDGF